MKTASDGQFRQIIANLLTNVSPSAIDFEEAQKLIKNHQILGTQFAYFLNNALKIFCESLYIVNSSGPGIGRMTCLTDGDVFVFNPSAGTLSIDRTSLSANEQVHFWISSSGESHKVLRLYKTTINDVLIAATLWANLSSLKIGAVETRDVDNSGKLFCIQFLLD